MYQYTQFPNFEQCALSGLRDAFEMHYNINEQKASNKHILEGFMYFQEDTVLRMIEQVGAFFRQLMRLLNDAEAEKALDEAFRDLCGMDRQTAKGMSVHALSDMLSPNRRLALFELMLMESQRFAQRMENEDILSLRHHALMLLCTVEDEEIAGIRAARARELWDECAELCTPEETGAMLRFLSLGGAYADAEDVLFLQLHAYPPCDATASLLETGRKLYERWLALTDEQLALGNLPRAEALEGQAALADWAQAHTTTTKEERPS